MRYAIVHPDITGRYDPPGVDCIRQTPGRVEDEKDADVVFIPVTRFDEFRFEPKLNDIVKPWVLFDWCEFGWQNTMETSYLWGKDRLTHPSFQNEEWEQFDKFVRDNPPLVVFQRELLERDVSDKVKPLDYLNWLPEAGNDDRDGFLKRPLDISYNFGRSHEGRMWFHGAVFQQAGAFGYHVISEFSHLEKGLGEDGPKWLSVHSPHFARLDVREVQKINRRALVNVILPGAGRRTFRLSECAGDAIMALPKHELAQAYPWDRSNSLMLPPLKSIESANGYIKIISDALMDRDGLYDTYCRAMDNALNFRPENYSRRWIGKSVERAIHG